MHCLQGVLCMRRQGDFDPEDLQGWTGFGTMSIVADTHALQTRLVQQLAELRRQELDQIVARFSNLGIQSSLIGGFSIQILLVVAAADTADTLHVHGYLVTLFYVTSYGCLLASSHSVVVTTFCTARAPLVALRGQYGALARVLLAVRRQQEHVDLSFVWSVILFVAQTFFYAWLNCVAETGNATTFNTLVVSAVILGAGWFSYGHTTAMLKAFNDADVVEPGSVHDAPAGAAHAPAMSSNAIPAVPEDVGYVAPDFVAAAPPATAPPPSPSAAPSSSSAAAEEGSEPSRLPATDQLAHNPMAAVHDDPDLFLPAALAPSDAEPPPSRCAIHGKLLKRVDDRGVLDKFNWAVEALLSADWRERYFLLSDRCLLYWRAHADFVRYFGGRDVTSAEGLRLLSRACDGAAAAEEEPRQAPRRPPQEGARGSGKESALAAPLVAEEQRPLREDRPLQEQLLPVRVDLGGYAVSVDMYDTRFGITLQPTPADSSRRTWHLRAPNDEARRLWTQKLVRATKWATQQRALERALAKPA